MSVDWLAASFWMRGPEEVEAALEVRGLSGWRDVDKGALGYRRQRVGAGEVRILYEGRTPETHVIVPGRACRSLGLDGMRELVRLVRREGRASRLDLAGDDYSRRVLPADLHAARLSGQLVTHAQRGDFLSSWGARGGDTFSVGTGGSRQLLRVYDKGAESVGAQDCIRFEIECRDEMAGVVVGELDDSEDWGHVWASRLCSFVDFRDRTVHENVSRCPRMPWWEALVTGAEKWGSYAPVAIVDVERAREWLERQVMPALAMVLEADGNGVWLREALARGEARWSKGHKEALKFAAEDAA